MVAIGWLQYREMFRRLVDAGCEPNVVDRRGRSVLMDAALNGRLDMFKLLDMVKTGHVQTTGRGQDWTMVKTGHVQVARRTLRTAVTRRRRHRRRRKEHTVLLVTFSDINN